MTHELAHVTYFAEGESNHWPDTPNSIAYNAAEHLVDDRLLKWAFSRQELRDLDAFLAARGIQRFLSK